MQSTKSIRQDNDVECTTNIKKEVAITINLCLPVSIHDFFTQCCKIASASRLLNKSVEMRYCDYTEELNEHKKRERKYYMTTSIKQTVVNRFHQIIRENTYLKNGLSKIRNDIAAEELSSNSKFPEQLELLRSQIDKLNEFYEKAIVLSKDFFDKL
ncbi:MAG: hypothetical protein ACFFD4_23855 [Candidatus Odinarchaeota archaeon]